MRIPDPVGLFAQFSVVSILVNIFSTKIHVHISAKLFTPSGFYRHLTVHFGNGSHRDSKVVRILRTKFFIL